MSGPRTVTVHLSSGQEHVVTDVTHVSTCQDGGRYDLCVQSRGFAVVWFKDVSAVYVVDEQPPEPACRQTTTHGPQEGR